MTRSPRCPAELTGAARRRWVLVVVSLSAVAGLASACTDSIPEAPPQSTGTTALATTTTTTPRTTPSEATTTRLTTST